MRIFKRQGSGGTHTENLEVQQNRKGTEHGTVTDKGVDWEFKGGGINQGA